MLWIKTNQCHLRPNIDLIITWDFFSAFSFEGVKFNLVTQKWNALFNRQNNVYLSDICIFNTANINREEPNQAPGRAVTQICLIHAPPSHSILYFFGCHRFLLFYFRSGFFRLFCVCVCWHSRFLYYTVHSFIAFLLQMYFFTLLRQKKSTCTQDTTVRWRVNSSLYV